MHHQVKLDATFLSLVIAVAVVEVLWNYPMWCWTFFSAGPWQESRQWTGPGCSCYAIRHESWLQDLIITQSLWRYTLHLHLTYTGAVYNWQIVQRYCVCRELIVSHFCLVSSVSTSEVVKLEELWRPCLRRLIRPMRHKWSNLGRIHEFVCFNAVLSHSWNDQPMF